MEIIANHPVRMRTFALGTIFSRCLTPIFLHQEDAICMVWTERQLVLGWTSYVDKFRVTLLPSDAQRRSSGPALLQWIHTHSLPSEWQEKGGWQLNSDQPLGLGGLDLATVAEARFISMMANRIKALVSKSKIRFKEDGFDLDLTCILYVLRVLSLGFRLCL